MLKPSGHALVCPQKMQPIQIPGSPLSEDDEEELDLIQEQPPISAKNESVQNHESFLLVHNYLPKKNGMSSSSEKLTVSRFFEEILVLQIHTAGETHMFCCVS